VPSGMADTVRVLWRCNESNKRESVFLRFVFGFFGFWLGCRSPRSPEASSRVECGWVLGDCSTQGLAGREGAYDSICNVVFLSSIPASATAPVSAIWLLLRLDFGDKKRARKAKGVVHKKGVGVNHGILWCVSAQRDGGQRSCAVAEQ
jgi:hypothetical protein